MSLPKIDMPMFELELPSNGKKVKYRPFTVKEEKILLIAQESKDPKQIITAIKQIVHNCLMDYSINDLSLFDLEYLLLSIRSRSIDNKIEFEIEDPETQEKISLTLDLSEVKIAKDPNHSSQIKLNDQYTLFLKYPTIDDFAEVIANENITSEKSFKILLSCIDKLVSEDDVHNFKDFSQKQIDDFIDSLHSDVTKKMKEFFDTIPKIRHEIPYINSAEKNKTFVVEGTQTFFI
jgi:citrate lyase gamma subunit